MSHVTIILLKTNKYVINNNIGKKIIIYVINDIIADIFYKICHS